jgi:hypothetical protein
MEKSTEFPSKNVRKNSLLFHDGVQKSSIYVQKIRARSSAVPPLLRVTVLREHGCAQKNCQVRDVSALLIGK